MGRLAVLPALLAIIMALSVAFGKNVAPRHFKIPKGITNKAPVVKFQDLAAPEQKASSNILPDHVFYENYRANFSWSDKRLQAALGIRPSTKGKNGSSNDKRSIVKRTPGDPNNPLLKLPSCLGCIEAYNGKVTTINDLTTEWLEQQLLEKDNQLQDRCVFYTSVLEPSVDLIEYTERKAMGHNDHPGLSWFATEWACSLGMVSIWNLYPGQNDISNPNPDDPKIRNFWEVFIEGSWLYFLYQNKQQFIYFENMSRAMARHYVMSMQPTRLTKYQYIWANVEWPTLKARYASGGAGAPTRLIAVDARSKAQYEVDINTLQAHDTPLERDDPDYLDFDTFEHDLQKRDTCTQNLAYEVNMDWFG
ncbi:hypothetical protein TgHK011_003331 [Trichoderma gracile]|nr:hypothetical protein TgHK011_003331 [Trichoderma gracile]